VQRAGVAGAVARGDEHEEHAVFVERDGRGEADQGDAVAEVGGADEGLDGEAEGAVVLDAVGEGEGVGAAEGLALGRQQRALRDDGVEVDDLEDHRRLARKLAGPAEDVEQVGAGAVGLDALEAVGDGQGERGRGVADDGGVGRGGGGGERRGEGERGAAHGRSQRAG
jgi:hypothetical protein